MEDVSLDRSVSSISLELWTFGQQEEKQFHVSRLQMAASQLLVLMHQTERVSGIAGKETKVLEKAPGVD